MELIKTEFTFSGDNRMIWSDGEYSPASAGKRRQRHSQTVDVAVFPWYISLVRRDVARPRRSAIFQIRAVASNRLWEFSPPARNFSLLLSLPSRLRGSSPRRSQQNPTQTQTLAPAYTPTLPSHVKYQMNIFWPYAALIQEIWVLLMKGVQFFKIVYFSSGGSNVYF